MNKIYQKQGGMNHAPGEVLSTEANHQPISLKGFSKVFKQFLLMAVILSGFFASAQTTLIDAAGDGGFNNGATFAANGWTVANSANNPWVVGTGVTSGAIGGNSAYVSTNGTSNTFTNSTPAVNYFYRDINVPAGETKIKLSFNWINNGETNPWDVIQVFVAPTTVVPAPTIISAGNATDTPVPTGITGATPVFLATTLQTTTQTATVFLPGNLAGTTFRLIFSWRNDTSGGSNPAGTIDNISLTSGVPGTFTSIASGNYGAASTWDANDVPSQMDNIVISAGHTVTVDATGQAANNATVSGILTYGTPTAFTIAKNLTVNAGGAVNVFSGTTGKTLNVGGDLTNNGTIDLSVGTNAAGILGLNGTVVQTVSGSGTFVNNKIRNLAFTNTSTAIPNINWLVNNISVEYNLNITNAKINLGTNTFTYGTGLTAALSGNTFDFINGGFMPGGKFSRWWTNGGAGYITAFPTAIPNSAGGRYPFYSASGVQRVFYLGRNSPTAGGQYAVTYNDATTMTTGLSVVDNAYTVTDRWDGNFVVTTEGTTPVATTYIISIFATNAFYPMNGNTRVMLQNTAIGGVHSTGAVIPAGQRFGVLLGDLTSATGLYLGINNVDIPYHPIVNGNWNDAAIWNKGIVPGCNDMVTVPAGITLTVNSAANSAKGVNIIAGGTLAIASGDLTVGCSANNATMTTTGTLTVTGGTLTVNGNMQHNIASTFNQSGGNIIIDGNNAGDTATSVASGTAHLNLNGNTINWTGGTLTIVDPHAATTSTNVLTCFIADPQNIGAGHTFRLGNGVSTDAGGNATAGFRISTNNSTGRLSLGNLQLSTAGGTNRFVTTASGFGINGNLTIDALSEFRDSAVTIHVAGNVVNNGSYIGTGTLAFQNNLSGVSTPVTTAQSLSGTGTFANALTTSTAKLVSLTVNNTSATGVTLDVPMSLSGTLTLTAGKLNTTSTNLLTINATTAASITGGNANAYVNGPLARTIASGNTATTFVNFPVGKGGAYAPIALAPVTTAATVIKAEAFDTNTGTANASIINLANNRRWETSIVSGTVTSTNVRIGDANLVTGKIPVTAPSAAGEYTATFGSLATFATATAPAVPTVTANAALPIANYSGFVSYAESNTCSGTPAPGLTIASANNICLGTSVNLSVAAATTGTGVTYQWQSSADGIAYADIDSATSTTLTVTPTASTYYQLKVTCSTGPATGTSTPVLVAFANTVAATAPAARCGLGTVTLGATPSAGASIAWYDAATNGNLVGNGNTFTTPAINANKTYYAAAQTTITGTATVGTATTLTGATDQPTAFCNRWPSYWSQTIYTAAELRSAGLTAGDITSMAYNVATLGDGATNGGFTVRIATVGSNTFANTTFLTTGFATVYGPQTYTHTATGWQTINFSTPYTWDGTSNIVVEVKMTGADSTNNSQTYFTATTGNNTVLWVNSFTGTTTAGALSVNRLNLMFGGQVACSSARVAVAATVTAPPALTLSSATTGTCTGQASTAVTLTSNAADYDSYVWSPSTGVSGTAATGWTFNPAANTVYTLTASQTAGSQCVTTATVAVTVNAVPSAVSIAAVPATNCTNNVVALAATGGTVNAMATIGNATTLTGDTEQPTAFNNRFTTYWSQTIYTAAELNAMGIYAGKISSMAYEVATLGSGATNTAFTVKIGATTATNFANTTFLATTAYATVFGPVTYTHTATGWQTITFATPYEWDGTSNLVINVTMGGANSTNNTQTYFTATTDDTTLSVINFTGTTTTGTLSKKRLNVRFTATNTTTMTWAPDTNLYTDAAATLPYVAGTNAATVYVKSATAGNTTYTATSTAQGSCTATQTVGVNIVDCGIGWGNLQHPATASIYPCESVTVYGRVWKENVTEAAGANPDMKAWVGVSTTNTNPNTWAEADWHQATYNVQDFNNDEYQYNITGLSAGTYYYAVRYQYLTGPYAYGGTNDNFWDGTTHISGVLTVNAVAAPAAAAAQTFCNSGTVANLVTTSGSGIKWYADATGGTALDGTTALVTGENYFASQTINGCEGTARTEVVVTITTLTLSPVADVAACGSYTLPTLTTGNYFTATNGGGTALAEGDVISVSQTVYIYATSGTCTAERMFDIEISNVNADDPADVTVCDSYTLPALSVGNNYFTQPNGGGTQLAAGTEITSNQTIYVYAVSGTNVTCTDENSFTVTVNSIDVADPADVTVCSSYTLPVLTLGEYYTDPNGTGIQKFAGDVITSNTTLYVYAVSSTTPACSDEETFTITISSFTITDPADVNVCDSYTLPALTTGEYRTAPAGGGSVLPEGTVIDTDQTIYVYAQSTGIPVCTAEQSFEVNITAVDAPTGAPEQVINAATPAEATIEDIVTNETGVIWFATEAEALLGTPALPAGTQVTAGSTYWGILTNGSCISEPFEVLITQVAGTRDVDMALFSYFPNPVKDVLNVKYSSDITSVEVFNMIGQKVLNKNINAAEGSVDMSQLADGTYIVNVTAGGAVKTIKVVKKQ